MRIALHDFSGHPFQAQLSRALAGHGHEINHSFSSDYVSGKGALELRPTDPPTLTFTSIDSRRPMHKYDFRKRTQFEISYARTLFSHVQAWKPDVVVLCNLPLLSLALVARRLTRLNVPWILWHQDIFSIAMSEEIQRRLPKAMAGPLSAIMGRVERRVVSEAHHTICIGPTFLQQYARWGIPSHNISVIPNWAPLDEITPTSRRNEWSEGLGIPVDRLRIFYSGTLGRKHNPLLLRELAEQCQAIGLNVDLTVISEGEGAALLAEDGRSGNNPVRLLPFQPHDRLSEVLSSADVLICLLEPSASEYSIPSKVLSYLSVGRPVLGFMGLGNPAAKDILEAGGLALEPERASISQAAIWLRKIWVDRELHLELSAKARRLAEKKFNISSISRQFESVARETLARSTGDAIREELSPQFAGSTLRAAETIPRPGEVA